LWLQGKRTPRYLEPQFEVGSLPVSEGAGMLLLGGGVGMMMAVWWCVFSYFSGGVDVGYSKESRFLSHAVHH
jgi:hypothetical protein